MEPPTVVALSEFKKQTNKKHTHTHFTYSQHDERIKSTTVEPMQNYMNLYTLLLSDNPVIIIIIYMKPTHTYTHTITQIQIHPPSSSAKNVSNE